MSIPHCYKLPWCRSGRPTGFVDNETGSRVECVCECDECVSVHDRETLPAPAPVFAGVDAWVPSWLAGAPGIRAGVFEFCALVRAAPERLKQLAVRFPPGTVVRGKHPLCVPAPGTCGVVAGYTRKCLLVWQRPPEGSLAEIPAECEPDWLEIVGYVAGIAPEDIEAGMRQGMN